MVDVAAGHSRTYPLQQRGGAVAGFIANPSFATGEAATSVQVLGVDFNGWHALAGLLIFAPGFFVLHRRDWARLYALAVIVSLVPSGIWAMFDSRPAGIWPFVHQASDAVLHLANAALYAALLGADRARTPRLTGVGRCTRSSTPCDGATGRRSAHATSGGSLWREVHPRGLSEVANKRVGWFSLGRASAWASRPRSSAIRRS